MHSDVILEGLYKSKLQESAQLQTVLAMYDQETARNSGKPNYSQLKTAVKLHIDQMMRKNSKLQGSVLWKEDQSPRVKKEKQLTLRGKWESVFSGRHMDNVSEETHAASVMAQWALETVALARDEKDDRLLPHPIRRQRLTARDKKPSKESGNYEESSSDKRSEIPCRFRICKYPSCEFGHPPVCQKKDVYTATNDIPDMLRQKESTAKGKIKVVQKRISCDIEGVYTIGLRISRFFSEKIYST